MTQTVSSNPNDEFKGRFRLAQNNYGKSDIRLVRVDRTQPRHVLKDVRVDVALEGDFTAAHVDGDNAGLLATDTMRNTVYALAQSQLTDSVEQFGMTLIRHFRQAGPSIRGGTVQLTEHLWDRMLVHGVQHDHAFTRASGQHTATVSGDGETFSVTSGINELTILKTTRSGWEGFLREQYTTLPETDDRILATVVDVNWEYTPTAVQDEATDYDAIFAGVLDQLQTSFADHYSPSMQYSLYRIGSAVLERFSQISRIHLSFPNRHHILYNLERFGMENSKTSDVQVLHADAEPYGLIEGWVERA
ncbi:factor-independent urate hydroxylase [Deinococcus sonorensis]|uniref:Uricase n=2 Tax=Deinococcus sonorensis TaxID=309891 RepID=A0AAU7UE65_9DEIO